MSNFTKAMASILEIVLKEKEYLEKNPKALAKVMYEYDDIHYSSRFHKNENKHDWDNPKYAVIELEEKTDAKYAALVYDAWCASLEDNSEEASHELESKPNKTMDEIVTMSMSPEYKYSSIYPDRRSVLNHYLCVIGTGIKWNKDGFLSDAGPDGNDMVQFKGYQSEVLPESIVNQFYWLEDKDIVKYREVRKQKTLERIAKEKAEDEKMKLLMETLKKKVEGNEKLANLFPSLTVPADHPFYPISEKYSNITTIPDNAHESYVEASKEICEKILANPKEDERNKSMARDLLVKLLNRK